MKRSVWMIAALVLGFGLWNAGCEITAEYPEMDTNPEPTLCEADDDCLDGVCDPVTGTCVECLEDSACPGGKFCNLEDKQCVTCYLDSQCATGACDEAAGICRECQADGDCSSGQCDATTGICIECGTNQDCVSNNACAVGVCVAGRCSFGDMPDGVACDDGDECTAGDYCQAGNCAGLAVPGCIDPTDPCASFDASGARMPDGVSCDDGDPCTLDDYCYMGKCVGDTVSPECADNDLDGDGYSLAAGDCNDLDATMNPGMAELCDSLDNDCDGLVDEECSGECVVSGCNGELCVDANMGIAEPTDCLWLPEYDCLMYTSCGPYAPGGVCGWIKTAEYVECINNLQTTCDADGGCPAGYACMNGVCVITTNPCATDADCGYMEVCMDGMCFPYTTECQDLGGVDLGACEMFIGYAMVYGQCTGISGCGCGGYCEAIFGSYEECQQVCGVTTNCYSSDQCAEGQVCMNGVCVATGNECESNGGMCVYGDFTEPTCPEGFYASPLAGCDMGICCQADNCWENIEICNGMDDNCNGEVDENACSVCDDGDPCTFEKEDPATGECYFEAKNCDDGNDCTDEYCDPNVGTCVYVQLPGCGYCSADSDCPAGLVCMNGMCTSTALNCWSDSQCASGQYCYFSNCALETGTCTTIPGACAMVYAPVCGCNGLTYGNLCLLMQSKQDLAYSSVCGMETKDNDGDGYGYDVDCDDMNPAVNPSAIETCDQLDNDCDGLVDEGCSGLPCNTDADCQSWEACVAGVCIALPD